MHIEVTIGSSPPVVHHLREAKTIVGSAENANIIIPSSAGISRKHLQLTVEGDKLYITDLGSTNGTFVNEERIVPGSRIEFTAFFPVRLGENVFISLLTDESEIPAKVPDEAATRSALMIKKEPTTTKNLSLNDINKTTTKAKIAQRERTWVHGAKRPKKVVPSRKAQDDARMKNTAVGIMAMVGLALAYGHFTKEDSTPLIEESSRGRPPTMTFPAAAALTPKQLDASELPSLETFQTAIAEVKCATTLEKRICALSQDLLPNRDGAVESVDKLIIVTAEEKWHKLSIEAVPQNSISPSSRAQLIQLFFLKDLGVFNWTEVEKNIFFVFYKTEEARPILSSVVGMKPMEVGPLLKLLPQDLLAGLRASGTTELPTWAKHVRVINDAKPLLEVFPRAEDSLKKHGYSGRDTEAIPAVIPEPPSEVVKAPPPPPPPPLIPAPKAPSMPPPPPPSVRNRSANGGNFSNESSFAGPSAFESSTSPNTPRR